MGVIFQDPITDIISLLTIIVTIAAYLVHRKYTYWQRNGIAYIKPTFPFGNFGSLLMQKTSLGSLTQAFYNRSTEPLLGVYVLFRPAILMRDPELIHNVFISDFQHFHDRGLYIDEKHDPLSGHLLALSGEKWKNLRSKLTPTFTSGKLKAMFSTLLECGTSLTKFMDVAASNGDTVEVRELLAQFTTNIIASVAFGLDIDCIADRENDFRKYGRKVCFGCVYCVPNIKFN